MASHDPPADPEDATHLDDGETRLAPAAPVSKSSDGGATSTTGWLSSSGAIDHGRFAPGTLLGGRYRIVGRLGRGGMGEVYRADDLKLAQPVALKFLPPEVDHDPARLMQLHTEVRMARQVSHPNVCRVYDIDEVEGHTFLSMEFVDGEELASLLRRIGRFSSERSLEIARQLCAGLAAAHERGVVHRDLKPANVMLDGTGSVRITDFGLAGLTGETIRAGTPAYMAPEQLAGGEVTAQSDIYSLGLVLYELFTGQRAIDAKNVGELVRKREAGVIPPSQLVRDLDPAIDRAILRCLERDPADRPSSALGVAAALPGGDPLAAALAAGETPSPEMVAASGSTSALGPVHAIAGLLTAFVLLGALAAVSDRVLLTNYVPLERPPEVLADRAREISRALGYTNPPVDTAWSFAPASDYLQFANERGDGAETRRRLRTGRPAGLYFWHRSSPRQMVPVGTEDRVSYANPPQTVSDMRLVVLDTEGRLAELQIIPPQMEVATTASPAPNWKQLFDLAGLDQSQFQAVAPQWTPRQYSDTRAAWEGPVPGWTEQTLRVEAASYRGRPVFFQLIFPWTRPALMREEPASRSRVWGQAIVSTAVVLVLAAAALVARHNLRKGKGDRRGAVRIAAVTWAGSLIAWTSAARHISVAPVEVGRFFTAVADALFNAGALWVLYLALEPYVRKLWPSTLVSWSRLIAGNYRDPKVGRDVLIGVLFGVGIVLVGRADSEIRSLFGYPVAVPMLNNVSWLEGVRMVVFAVGTFVFSAMFNSLWITFGIVAINLIVRRMWITAIVMTLFLMITAAGQIAESNPVWVALITNLLIVLAMMFVLLKLGLLATIVMFFVNFLLSSAVLTLDTSKWFFPTSVTAFLMIATIATYGFYASRGGEPILGRRILD
jgi:tRNA A-37 threonylcarbamoyl transferase component Bud32